MIYEDLYKSLEIEAKRVNEKFIPSTGECIDYDLEYPPFTLEKQIKVLKSLTQGRDVKISGHPAYEMDIFDGETFVKVKDEDFSICLQKLLHKYLPVSDDPVLIAVVKEVLSD